MPAVQAEYSTWSDTVWSLRCAFEQDKKNTSSIECSCVCDTGDCSTWQVAVSTTDLFKRTVDFEIEASSCTRDRFTVSFVNLEKDRVLTWNQARLISIDGEQLEATMTFPGYQRRHVPPLSATLIVFNIESKIIDNMIKLDEGISNIRIVMSVNATDADGTKETSKSTICVYSDARTSLN